MSNELLAQILAAYDKADITTATAVNISYDRRGGSIKLVKQDLVLLTRGGAPELNLPIDAFSTAQAVASALAAHLHKRLFKNPASNTWTYAAGWFLGE